jgi:hypothetical protein
MRGKHQDYDQNYDQTYDQNYDQKYYQKYKKYKTLYKQARRRQVDGRQAYGGAKDDLGGLGDLGSLDDSGNAGASGSGGDDLGGLGGLGDDGDSAGAGKTNPIGVQMGAPAPQKPVVNKEDLDALEKDVWKNVKCVFRFVLPIMLRICPMVITHYRGCITKKWVTSI